MSKNEIEINGSVCTILEVKFFKNCYKTIYVHELKGIEGEGISIKSNNSYKEMYKGYIDTINEKYICKFCKGHGTFTDEEGILHEECFNCLGTGYFNKRKIK